MASRFESNKGDSRIQSYINEVLRDIEALEKALTRELGGESPEVSYELKDKIRAARKHMEEASYILQKPQVRAQLEFKQYLQDRSLSSAEARRLRRLWEELLHQRELIEQEKLTLERRLASLSQSGESAMFIHQLESLQKEERYLESRILELSEELNKGSSSNEEAGQLRRLWEGLLHQRELIEQEKLTLERRLASLSQSGESAMFIHQLESLQKEERYLESRILELSEELNKRSNEF